MAPKSFWQWHGRTVTREELARLTVAADRKLREYDRVAERAARRVMRGDVSAEREGRAAERQVSKWRGELQARMAALAAGDKRKRDSEVPPPGKWRYWVRMSYLVPQHENVTEVYFNERSGKRLTDAEAIDAVAHVLHGDKQAHIRWNRVMYGRSDATKRAKPREEVIFAFVLDGDVEEIGEQQYVQGRWQTVRDRKF